jgi:hypothetical protein
MWIFIVFAQAVATRQKDFGVLDDTIGDGSGDSGVVEDVAPVGKCCVGRDERGALTAVASRDDLIKKVWVWLLWNDGPASEFCVG